MKNGQTFFLEVNALEGVSLMDKKDLNINVDCINSCKKKFLAHCVLNEPAFCERQKMFRDGAM